MIAVGVCLLALGLLIFGAYRGFSVILLAPVAALLAVVLTDAAATPAIFSGVFMEKMVGFLKAYFPVFLLGAVFGKLIEVSGFSNALVGGVIRLVGPDRVMLAIVCACALLTYGGVSLFVVVFAAYPFAAGLFRQADIPKRLLPATIALGAFTFTMDSLPGTPQIQNIIPTTFFGTSTWAAPILGVVGGLFIASVGLAYLEARRRRAARAGEGYGEAHANEPEAAPAAIAAPVWVAMLPLLAVAGVNLALTQALPQWLPPTLHTSLAGLKTPVSTDVSAVSAIWAVEAALICGIAMVVLLAFRRVSGAFREQSKVAVSGALLAALNTASEYGFGAVIAALPGFVLIQDAMAQIPHPLAQEAVAVTTLAGLTGSASGGLSIALGTMSDRFLEAGAAHGVPAEVLHRVAAMASGGMDTLPHNGAIITLLAVTGLTHRQSYPDILALTAIKTAAVAVVIGVYLATGVY